MILANLDKLLQDVKALSSEEQQLVRQALDETHTSTCAAGYATEGAFQQQLIDAGLLREIKHREARQMPSARRQRVAIQGKPLSETVIEERR